ncbi:MAG: hypothetical protein M3Q78_05315 [Acidobacteriota bacterium]|nr:hypothetical protein [Acidobacteriota bacterium]
MNKDLLSDYKIIRDGGIGFYEQKRGLIEVSGKEAIQLLNGMITNDVAKLETYDWMLAAFPNANGRLLAVVRVLRFDETFLFETEDATHAKVFQNLFRFTFAGDFRVEDVSEEFSCLSVRAKEISNFKYKIPTENQIVAAKFDDGWGFIIRGVRADGFDVFLPKASKVTFENDLKQAGAVEMSDELYEVLRVENGIPLYGVDMDETTIVPEIGLPELISYNKGCYIGQEIIARIHFRGHVAKQLTGLILAVESQGSGIESELQNAELKSLDGKNAGRLTSLTFSPKLNKFIALAYIRYDYLVEGTELKIGEVSATVKDLPSVG